MLPAWLQVMVLASLPVVELRAAIPLALTVFGMSPTEAYLFSVAGNLVPMPFIFLMLVPALKWLSQHSPKFHSLLENHFLRLKKEYKDSFEKWGAVALFTFVVIPGPGTGLWTACGLAVLTGIRFRYAAPAITAGVLAAGAGVLGLSTGAIHIFS